MNRIHLQWLGILLAAVLSSALIGVGQVVAAPLLYGSALSVFVAVDPVDASIAVIGSSRYDNGQANSLANLAFDSTSGVLYGNVFSSLVTVDPLTAALTVIGSTRYSNGQSDSLTNLAFDPVSGVLYGTALSSLVTVDPLTAGITVIGSTRYNNGQSDSLTTLVFAVPEAPTWGILSLALGLMYRCRLRVSRRRNADFRHDTPGHRSAN